MTRHVPLAAAAALALLLAGCTNPPPEATSTPAAPSAQGETPRDAPAPGSAPEGSPAAEPAPSTLVPPVRGTAEVAYLKPVTKAGDRLVVTTFRIRNASAGPIAGLKLEEFWWDKAGNPLTGSSVRLKTPLKPGEITTLTLETPKVPGMYQCNFRFSHANGAVRAVVATSLD